MSTRRQLNSAAPELLDAAKFALRELAAAGNPAPQVFDRLQAAIESVEKPDDWKFAFHTTHKTWSWISTMLKDTNDGSAVHKKLFGLIKKGSRKTQRRVYCSVIVDIPALTRFRYLLANYEPSSLRATSRAFDRIIKALDETIFKKSPLEILAEQGL